MKRLEGFDIQELTNEVQIYDGVTGNLLETVWKSGDKAIDRQRLSIALENLTK